MIYKIVKFLKDKDHRIFNLFILLSICIMLILSGYEPLQIIGIPVGMLSAVVLLILIAGL